MSRATARPRPNRAECRRRTGCRRSRRCPESGRDARRTGGMKVDDQDVSLPQRQGERRRAAQLYARSHRGSRGASISPARPDQSRPAVALYNPDDACTQNCRSAIYFIHGQGRFHPAAASSVAEAYFSRPGIDASRRNTSGLTGCTPPRGSRAKARPAGDRRRAIAGRRRRVDKLAGTRAHDRSGWCRPFLVCPPTKRLRTAVRSV